jgi:hypothetical protein
MPRSLRTIPRVPRGRTALALGLTGAMGLSVVSGVNASSHREAPMIAQDPVADNTDVYAFVSPDAPDTVTLIANWIPAEDPAAGPTYYRFGEDVLYSIHIDNNGDAVEDITYEWRFRDEILNPDTILYATGVIGDETGDEGTILDDPNYNVRQRYDLFVVRDGARRALITNAILPPNNVGIVTPNYEAITEEATYDLPGGGQTFTGQRDDAFFGDIGSIFDLGQLRPFLPAYQPAPRDAQEPVDFFAGYNVHTTSIQVPISELVQGDEPVIGVWSTSSRPKVRVFSQNNGANPVNRGRFVQISRLGNPLVNEVVVPFGLKDTFNALAPRNDAAALSQPADEDGVTIPLVQRPELAGLITALYGPETPPAPRDDLVSIFLTGIEGLNQPANVQPADLLRLNTSIAPTGSNPNDQNRLGLLAGENDGFPNGRRLGDDVVDIGLRAVAGGTPLTPEFDRSPNNQLADGVDGNDLPFLNTFPYQATPYQGYGENNELRGRTTNGASTVTQPGLRQ